MIFNLQFNNDLKSILFSDGTNDFLLFKWNSVYEYRLVGVLYFNNCAETYVECVGGC